MTLQKTVTLTSGETALIDAYRSALSDLPGNGDVMSARDRMIGDLKRYGLPTRRVESWHYTDLKALLKTVPTASEGKAKPMPVLIPGSHSLSILNGVAQPSAKVTGVNVALLRDQLRDGTYAAKLMARGSDDAIGRINGVLVKDGLIMTVEADTILDHPLEIQSVHAGGLMSNRVDAYFSAGAKATVLERHLAMPDSSAALVSSVGDIVLDEGADITWIIVQQQGTSDTHLGQINVTLGADAKLRLFVINAGGKLVRQEIHVVAKGEGADLMLRGINLLGGDSHTDVTLTLGHDVPNTTSTETIRSVVFDNAKGVFQGQIRVAPDAQKTDARMACNTLLLSDDAEFSVKPELEIFADDVQCAHGATVADIDKTQLYYLRARGIPENKARGLLVQAFVAEIVEELEDEALVDALESMIADWLDTHA
jgi:Fe-S cluster assembly protein SufD